MNHLWSGPTSELASGQGRKSVRLSVTQYCADMETPAASQGRLYPAIRSVCSHSGSTAASCCIRRTDTANSAWLNDPRAQPRNDSPAKFECR